jgi:multidrug efflux pump subunit AcrA (membrane-fusion protein)
VDEGTVIATGQPVVRLVENGKPEVRIGVPVSMAGKLSPGIRQQVKIGEASYQGTVSSILPEVDSSTRTQTVVLKLDSSAAFAVAPGTIARLEIEQTITTKGYWLPTTALVKGERGLWSCYVVREIQNEREEVRGIDNHVFQELSGNGVSETAYKVESRDIEVLHTEGNRVLVRGTLQPGERIIARGTQRVVSGQLVLLKAISY